jgi:pyruvate formate-lyase/glycerol dehydratase family glycyl radical enzyme
MASTKTLERPTTHYGSCTDRVRRLREQYFTVQPAVCTERAAIYTQSYRETEGLHPSPRRAKAFARVCAEKSVTILDDELIVGMPGSHPRSGIFCPEIAWRWLESELDTIATRSQDPYALSEEQKALLRDEILPYWRGRSAQEYFLANLPESTRAIACETGIIDVEIKSENGPGEFSPGYENILLRKGYGGIAEAARAGLEKLDPTQPDAFEKIRFMESVVTVCEAARTFAARYADEAERLAATASPQRAAELRAIAEVCRRVPWEPPATFRDGLQAIWFSQVMLNLEENSASVSPGRLDQYLYPLLRADLDAGRITKEAAQELIECLWIKMSGMTWLLNANCAQYFAGYMPFANVNVGGTQLDGSDATNELSFMMVQATMDLRVSQPSLAVFVHKHTPPEFMRHVCRLISLGTGFPAVHSVEVTVQMLRNKGISEEDARHYCMGGCVEPGVHGRLSQWSDGGHYNFGAAVQFALDNGRNWADGRQLGVPTGEPEALTTFDDFKEAVRAQLRLFMREIAVANLVAQKAHATYLPKPLSSALMSGCVESATDIIHGGAQYNAGPAFIGTGIADLADSLAAVKKLVYDEGALTLPELVTILKKDFDGAENVRQMLLNRAPKYGNDLDEVDQFAREFTDYAAELLTAYHGNTGGEVINGLYPVSSHVPHGKVVGALPSGRKAWRPLADGCSPFQGYDRAGPTASIRSVAKIDHARHTAGTLLNMKLNPALVADERGLDNLAALIRSFFELGGFHVQFNVISGDTLRAAQREPEKYTGLIVRVAGYSAYFADLCEEIQDDIIARTEYGSCS